MIWIIVLAVYFIGAAATFGVGCLVASAWGEKPYALAAGVALTWPVSIPVILVGAGLDQI